MNRNRILCLLLLPVLLLSLLPGGVWAQASEEFYMESPVVQGIRTRSTVQGPTLASGTHAQYIDRLNQLPDYALSLYRWLEDNATASGALADPTQGTEKDGNYGYLARQFTGSETFTYSTVEGMKATAKELAQAAFKAAFDSYMAYAGAVYNAFDRDHPEVFWLSGSSYYSYSGKYSYRYSGNTCVVTYQADMMFWLSYGDFDIRSEDYRSVWSISQGIQIRENAVKQILAGCTATTPWEQVKYLNNALTTRNAYNTAVAAGNSAQACEDAWECISALEGRVGNTGPVCEGYARALKVLCDRLGIPCVLVNGTARETAGRPWTAHMWNYVQLDGSWYAVDVTWNDPMVSGITNGKVSGYETETWLLVGSNTVVAGSMTFAQSRNITNNVSDNGLQFTNEPVLAKDKYVYREPHRHTEQTVSGYGATCTAAGLTNGVICSECGEVLTAQTVIPAKGHSLQTIPGYGATCTGTGLTNGEICTVCKAVITAQEEIPAIGHSLQTVPGMDATCTEAGLTEGEICTVCDAVLTAQEEIPAIGHSHEAVITEPTATQQGYTTYTCACGDSYVADYVDALGLSLTGAFTSGAEGDITLELLAEGEVVATVAVSGKTGEYTLEGVLPGTYTLKVSKENHLTREYTVTLEEDAVALDVKICLMGDLSGDGRVNVGDVVKLYSYIRGAATVEDPYLLACANVNGGGLNIGDAVAIYGHCRGTKKLY